MVKEFATFRVLHNHVPVVLRLDDIVTLYDVWVLHLLEDADFTNDQFSKATSSRFVLVYYLDRYFFSSQEMSSQADFAELARTKHTSNSVVANDLLVLELDMDW